ncbi:MAG: hypothetical protein RR855_04665, partial [Comamonas sp.]
NSLIRALAQDLKLGADFNPLDADWAQPWNGPRPELLAQVDAQLWRSTGDTRERLELLSLLILEREALIYKALEAINFDSIQPYGCGFQ